MIRKFLILLCLLLLPIAVSGQTRFFGSDVGGGGGGGSGGTPGGADTQVQYNDANVFGGNAEFTINKTTFELNAQSFLATPDTAEDGYDVTIPVSSSGVPYKTTGELVNNSALLQMIDTSTSYGLLIECVSGNCAELGFGFTNNGTSIRGGIKGGIGALDFVSVGSDRMRLTNTFLIVNESMSIGWSNNAVNPDIKGAAFDYDGIDTIVASTNGGTTADVNLSVGAISVGDSIKHDGYVVTNPAEVQTTDATVAVLDTLTLLDENTYQIEALVVGVQSDGANRASYHLAATVYRTGAGAATLQGSVTSMHTQESNASWDATFTVSVNDIRVSVTGVAATIIEWGSTLTYINMSN